MNKFEQERVEQNRSWLDNDLLMKVEVNSTKSPMGWKASEAFLLNIEKEYAVQHRGYLSRYEKWLAGMTRAVYLDEEMQLVYKVPLSRHGVYFNELEEAVANQRGFDDGRDVHLRHIPMAMCILDKGVLVMEMVKVDVKPTLTCGVRRCQHTICQDIYQQYPNWVWDVDHGQVGYNCNGDLVAYDL